MIDGTEALSRGTTVLMMTFLALAMLLTAIVMVTGGDIVVYGFILASGAVLEGIIGRSLFGRRALWTGIAAGAAILAISFAIALL